MKIFLICLKYFQYFYECKKLNAYQAEDPLQSQLRLYLGLDEDAEAREVVTHNLRIMQVKAAHNPPVPYDNCIADPISR